MHIFPTVDLRDIHDLTQTFQQNNSDFHGLHRIGMKVHSHKFREQYVESYDTERTDSESTFSHEETESILPPDPKTWALRKKWTIMGLVSWLCFVSPLASSMPSPATPLMNAEFENDSQTLSTFAVSFFILGYVIGSLITAPLSEQYGRKVILDIATFFFAVWQLACAVAPDITTLLIFRLFAGFAGSACLSVGGGLVADLFESKERGVATAVFALGPLLGPVIGPVIGGFLSQASGWRWVYWLLFILGSITFIVHLFVSKETNYKVIVMRHSYSRSQPPSWYQRLDWPSWQQIIKSKGAATQTVGRSMLRPWKLIFVSPISGVLCLYSGFVYGLLYLLLTTITSVFVERYGWTIGESGLPYLGLGLGFLIGIVVIGGTSDKIMQKQEQKHPERAGPEIRLKVCVWFSFLIPVSFMWYGWSADRGVMWVAPVTGLMVFGLGMIGIFLPVQTYMIDAFPDYAASSTAALASSRNVVGTFLPLAGPHLYRDLGIDWGNGALGFIALLAIPSVYLIAKYGHHLRMKYPVEL